MIQKPGGQILPLHSPMIHSNVLHSTPPHYYFSKVLASLKWGKTAAFPSACRKKPQSHFFNQWKLGFKIRMITLALGSIQISPLGL